MRRGRSAVAETLNFGELGHCPQWVESSHCANGRNESEADTRFEPALGEQTWLSRAFASIRCYETAIGSFRPVSIRLAESPSSSSLPIREPRYESTAGALMEMS